MEKTTERRLAEMERWTEKAEQNIRVGVVTAVDTKNGTARVSWPDGVLSGDMRYIKNGTGWTPEAGQRVVSIHRISDGAGYILGAV